MPNLFCHYICEGKISIQHVVNIQTVHADDALTTPKRYKSIF